MTQAAKEAHCGHPNHPTCACGPAGGDWHHDLTSTPNAAVRDHCVAIRTLLSELVNTVGAVLTSRPKHVWQVYGGFQRIYEAIKNIFYHGCTHTDTLGNADIWPFVVGLRVLSPVLGPYIETFAVSKPADEWIRSSLQKLQLAAKVAALTNDKDYIKKHYQPWALFCSPAHTGAVVKCLQALEENSQDLLADIDPKLLVGTQWISSSLVNDTIHCRPSGLPRYLISGPLLDKKSQSHEERNTVSLPTSPITDKNWAPVWPSQSDEIKRKGTYDEFLQHGRNASKTPTDPITVNKKCGRRLFVNDDITPLRRGKSEASIKFFSKGMSNPWELPVRNDEPNEHNITLMSRESPDGSSGSSDWPATSPVSRPSTFIGKDTSQVSGITSQSTISKLVQGKAPLETVNATGTGARPKDLSSAQPLSIQQLQELSDSGSAPRNNISPSLIKVEYGGDATTSEGEASSLYSMCHHRAGLGFRTPQLRRRASSWRMMSVPADSDPDSEDTTDGSLPHASRRRKRLTASQQRSDLSVKLLVDSRGVLVGNGTPEIDKRTGFQETRVKHLGSEISSKQQNALKLTSHSSIDSPSEPLSQISSLSEPVKPHGTIEADITVPHPKSPPISATLPPDVSDGIAFSAPGRVSKSGNLEPLVTAKSKKKTHGRSRSDGAQELVGKLRLSSSNTAPTLESKLAGKISGSNENIGSVIQNPVRIRFMEDGGHSIAPAADYGFFPRPQPGQSIIEFLSSKEFHKRYADLDRENAHFNISEAVIAALTQMQFDKWQREVSTSPITADDSDEEIRNLQARIREKRRQKLSSSAVTRAATINTITESTSDPQRWVRSLSTKIESTTDYSVCESPQSSTYNSESDLLSDFEEEDLNSSSVSGGETTVSLSRKTSVSDSAVFKGDLTAENVALNLLKHFNEQKLPKASELEWLVSEQEVPQKLLPLPTSVAVSPDDNGPPKDPQAQMQLRGTSEWAPPRPQLILSLHTNTKRSVLMGTQGWRCAGCGMRVSERLSRHFRLCHYLGRYFCTTCHSNQTAIIPAKVLHKWDFKLYPVASFSSELLERMRSDPLFNVGALNPRLYKRCRHLHQTHIYRLQLYYTLPYVNTCSRAQSERAMLGKLPPHWANDPHVYSIDDLIAIKSGKLVADIKEVTCLSINHIAKCQVCLGRGFICEVCSLGEAIFPFQLDSTALCESCNACYHAGCFSPARCPRCIRRESRRSSREVIEKEKEDSPDTSSSKES